MGTIDAKTIDTAVGWWVARLRGEDDIGEALDEFDLLKGMPSKAQTTIPDARQRVQKRPLLEEKILGFATDLREWLSRQTVDPNRSYASYVSIKTDYGASYEPLHDITERHKIDGMMRLPWKTRMHVFPGKVVVNERVIYEEKDEDVTPPA